jgi:hypothetical protein
MKRQISRLSLVGLAVLAATVGCAHRPTSFMPSAAVMSERAIPPGSWRGTVGGRETGDAQGEELGTAEFTITPDGQFTLDQTFSNMQGLNTMRATGTARAARGRIILDGHIVTPEARKGEPFVATLQPRGNALYGNTDVLYRGGRVGSIIELGRLS